MCPSLVRDSLCFGVFEEWGGGTGYSRNEDVCFMGPDRKSIRCNVYHSAIISPANGRTIIQSFRPVFPEALSQVFKHSMCLMWQ